MTRKAQTYYTLLPLYPAKNHKQQATSYKQAPQPVLQTFQIEDFRSGHDLV